MIELLLKVTANNKIYWVTEAPGTVLGTFHKLGLSVFTNDSEINRHFYYIHFTEEEFKDGGRLSNVPTSFHLPNTTITLFIHGHSSFPSVSMGHLHNPKGKCWETGHLRVSWLWHPELQDCLLPHTGGRFLASAWTPWTQLQWTVLNAWTEDGSPPYFHSVTRLGGRNPGPLNTKLIHESPFLQSKHRRRLNFCFSVLFTVLLALN